MTPAEQSERIDLWRSEEQQPFTGWDFSHLEGRMLEEKPPWDYLFRAAELLEQSSSVLDIGTGGGERLLRLKEHWPARVTVTEDYPPNVRLATERLGPLDVRVVDVGSDHNAVLPFADGEFDLVLDRHSSYNAHEVARILAPGGTFLTQQVHGLWAQDLLAAFGAQPKWPDETLLNSVARLETAGPTIVTAQDWSGRLQFTDVGAVVYYLKAVPWLVPGFSVQTHLASLLELQDRLDRGEALVFEARTYWIEARKALYPDR